jgi:hypothetical protein
MSVQFSRDEYLRYAIGKWVYQLQMARTIPPNEMVKLWNVDWTLENISVCIEDETDFEDATIQNYQLTLLRNYQLTTIPSDGTSPEQKILQNHYLGSGIQIVEHFHTFFKPYTLYNNKTNIPISFIDVTSIHDSDESIHILLEIKYLKNHYPFPIPHYSIEQLEQERLLLLRYADNMQHTIFNLNSSIMLMNEKIINLRQRSHRVILDQYEKEKEKHDCPVCFLEIDSERLFIPDCYHFICSQCASQCERCPICRCSIDPLLTTTHKTQS